jgi:hypothetical protein
MNTLLSFLGHRLRARNFKTIQRLRLLAETQGHQICAIESEKPGVPESHPEDWMLVRKQ